MNFLSHPSFLKEIKAHCKKHRSIPDGLESLERLLATQFDPISPAEVIGPSKIHRIHEAATWEIWKVKLALPKSGLKPGQWPRIWFVVSGETIAFLVSAIHADNYEDNDMEELAKSRATDIF